MADLVVYLGNKNYSSWSLRAWLALKHVGEAFEEEVIPLRQKNTHETILRYSPSGTIPVLHHGERVVWDTMAICEYLAETFPAARLWPVEVEARAVARSVSGEMHGGFMALRRNMPMNVRSSFPGKGVTEEVQADINRITALWRDCRKRFGAGGPFLFGEFTVADAMYAPVVTRFATYGVELDEATSEYARTIDELPAMQEWREAAKSEPWMIEEFEF